MRRGGAPVKAITALIPDAPPRATFTVVVSTLNIPGHPSEEYTVETHTEDGFYTTTYVATQEGGEVAQHRNMGALLDMLMELP